MLWQNPPYLDFCKQYLLLLHTKANLIHVKKGVPKGSQDHLLWLVLVIKVVHDLALALRWGMKPWNSINWEFITQFLFLGLFKIRVCPFCPTFGLAFVDKNVELVKESSAMSFFWLFLKKKRAKCEKMLVSALFLTHLTWNNMFGDLANHKTEFVGVQSNLQSNFNYRREKKRLELNFYVKTYKIKVLQECFIHNSF